MSKLTSWLGLSGTMWGYAIDLIPLLVATVVIYLSCSMLRNKSLGIRVNPLRKLAMLAFVCYCSGLWGLVLTPLNFWYSMEAWILGGVWPPSWAKHLFTGSFQFVPTLVRYFSGELTMGSWVRTMGIWNILLFVPMGFFLPLLWRRYTSWRGVVLGIGIGLAVELLQPIIGRSFDIDDLMAYTIGVVLGLCLCLLLGHLFPTLLARFRKGNPATKTQEPL